MNLNGWIEETIARAVARRAERRLFGDELADAAREIAREFNARSAYAEAEALLAEAPAALAAAAPDERPSEAESSESWTIGALEDVLLIGAVEAGGPRRLRAAREADDDLEDARAELRRVIEEREGEEDFEELRALYAREEAARARIAAALAAEGARR